MKNPNLKKWNMKYVRAVEEVAGVRAGKHIRTAWLKAMRKIQKDPVRFYLDRIYYHNRRIRNLHEEIEVHHRKIHTLTIMVKRIERKRTRS
jgi:hypothetical protein